MGKYHEISAGNDGDTSSSLMKVGQLSDCRNGSASQLRPPEVKVFAVGVSNDPEGCLSVHGNGCLLPSGND